MPAGQLSREEPHRAQPPAFNFWPTTGVVNVPKNTPPTYNISIAEAWHNAAGTRLPCASQACRLWDYPWRKGSFLLPTPALPLGLTGINSSVSTVLQEGEHS